MNHNVRTERVELISEGIELVGTLRVPETGQPVPAGCPLRAVHRVKDQVTGTYADGLARAGIATPALDHRGFGRAGAGGGTRTPRAS